MPYESSDLTTPSGVVNAVRNAGVEVDVDQIIALGVRDHLSKSLYVEIRETVAESVTRMVIQILTVYECNGALAGWFDQWHFVCLK